MRDAERGSGTTREAGIVERPLRRIAEPPGHRADIPARMQQRQQAAAIDASRQQEDPFIRSERVPAERLLECRPKALPVLRLVVRAGLEQNRGRVARESPTRPVEHDALAGQDLT
jgi:hypothetical protein